MIRLKIDIHAGLVEVEGDEEFVKQVYEDFKASLGTHKESPKTSSQVDRTPSPKQKSSTNNGAKKKTGKSVKGSYTYEHELASKLDSGSSKLTTFYNERYPSSGFEQNALFVYFLEKILKKANITVDDVYTCYKFLDKPNPTALRQSLIDTSNKKQWLNTSSMEDIKISSKGDKLVSYDLKNKPEKAKK
jgi:hypothetical protein